MTDDENLVGKMESLQARLDRLNRERNTLLESNKRLVTLLEEMESFVQHNVEVDRISDNKDAGDTPLDPSEGLDFDRMQSQVRRIESEIHSLRDD